MLPGRRRNIGSIRQLPSTRFSASVRKYGIRVAAPKTFDSYAEASAWCEKVVNELWQAKYQVLQQNGLASSILNSQNGSDGRSVTLSEFAADWMNGNIHLRDRTKYDYQRIIDRWLKVNVNGRKFTDHYLTELDLLLVKKWVEEVSKEASTSTVQYAYRVLRAILNEAAAAGLPTIADWEHNTVFHGAWRAPRDIFEMNIGLQSIIENFQSYRSKALETAKELDWYNRTTELIQVYQKYAL